VEAGSSPGWTIYYVQARDEILLEILRLGAAGDVTPDRMDEQMRGLSGFDKDWVYKNERLTNHVIKAALPCLTV
jgi:hypothetical protein